MVNMQLAPSDPVDVGILTSSMTQVHARYDNACLDHPLISSLSSLALLSLTYVCLICSLALFFTCSSPACLWFIVTGQLFA
jgi:hypothetical protein